MHALYLGGVYISIGMGFPLRLSALIVGLQPLLTSTIANRLLGERVVARQWGGLLLGIAGVYLVVQDKATTGGAVDAFLKMAAVETFARGFGARLCQLLVELAFLTAAMSRRTAIANTIVPSVRKTIDGWFLCGSNECHFVRFTITSRLSARAFIAGHIAGVCLITLALHRVAIPLQ